jgi:hypothetical protein
MGCKALPILALAGSPGMKRLSASSANPACRGPSPKPFSFIDKGRHYDSIPVYANSFGNFTVAGASRFGPGPETPG